jgi:hypothetical protein
MAFSPKTAVLIAALFAFTMLLNIPFGYWRSKARKYSFRWFLYIHLPIPLVFLGRVLSHIGFVYVPFFVAAAVIGQIWGGRLRVQTSL